MPTYIETLGTADGGATFGAITWVNGVGTFTATLTVPTDSQTISVTDGNDVITGTSAPFAVIVGPATHFIISTPLTAVKNGSFAFTVTAVDSLGYLASDYSRVVHITSTDAGAVLPANLAMANGTGVLTATLKTFGSQTITAADAILPTLNGTSAPILVGAGAATHFSISAPSSAQTGSPLSFTVTALDQYSNVATTYNRTAQFTSTDSKATLPANTMLTGGVGTFSASLPTAGDQTITATDTLVPTITGTSADIVVAPLAASYFLISAPVIAVAGIPFTFTVTAHDAFNNIAIGYTGTVHFTTTDSVATSPVDATLTNGVGTFGMTLLSQGAQSISATDNITSSITGITAPIAVVPGPASHFVIEAPSEVIAGADFTFTRHR